MTAMQTIMKRLILLLLPALFLVSCDSPIQTDAPHWKVKRPTYTTLDWQVESPTLQSDMTLFAALPDSVEVGNNDRLAVFCKGKCIALTETPTLVDNKRYVFLVQIYQVDVFTPLVIAYANEATHTILYWDASFSYSHDAIIGHIDDPYILDPEVARYYPYNLTLSFNLPENLESNRMSNDELAVIDWDGDVRAIVDMTDTISEKLYRYVVEVPMKETSEQFVIRYYSGNEQRIIDSQTYTLYVHDIVPIINPIEF